MKKLLLRDVLTNMQAKIIQGQSNFIIEDIVTKCKNIEKGRLLIDRYKKSDIPEKLGDFSFAVITERPSKFIKAYNNAIVVQVNDVEAAYWQFVEYYRSLFNIPLIGVTGTCGKTTTKEMTRHILSQKLNVTATYKSYNAQYHHLSYLLEIDDKTQAAVIEMGVAYPDDLLVACRFFKPQVGIITNIGVDHLNAFDSQADYVKGKAKFIEGLGYKGTLVINADDDNIKTIDFRKFRGDLVKYGLDDHADFQILDIKQQETGLDFVLRYSGVNYNFFVPGYGDFLVKNATAAIAAAHAVGFKVKEAGEALRTFHNVERHFEVKKGVNGGLVIDDTWSTNPTSAAEALKVLKSLSKGKKIIAVLSKMSLLGKQSAYYHKKIGKEAAKIGVDELIVIGEEAQDIGHGALAEGMTSAHVHFCTTSEEVLKLLYKMMDKNSTTLIKTTMLASYKDIVDKVTAH